MTDVGHLRLARAEAKRARRAQKADASAAARAAVTEAGAAERAAWAARAAAAEPIVQRHSRNAAALHALSRVLLATSGHLAARGQARRA